MKYNRHTYAAFTLIELIVAISIFGIIMISVMSIFLLASETGGRVEISRILQQNTKNITEDVAQSIREAGVHDVSENLVSDCSAPGFVGGSPDVKTGNKLCITGGVTYFVAQKDISSGTWYRIGDMTICQDPIQTAKNPCRIVRKKDGSIAPLTNNKVNVSDVVFTVVNKDIPRVTLQINIHPSYGEGTRSEIVKNTDFFFQTSLSERIILQN